MNNELYHHGVKGQKWGVRRYQRKDGTYTNAGRKRLARQAGRKAAEESWANSKATMDGKKLGSGRKAMNASAAARRKAESESLRSTRAHNKQARAEKKETKAYQKAYMKDAEAAYKRAGIKNFNPKTGDYTIDKNGTYRHKKTGAVISQKDFKLAWDYSAERRYRKERAQQWLMASPILAVSAASIVAVGADYALNKR